LNAGAFSFSTRTIHFRSNRVDTFLSTSP
jgi:hypothetical protein